MTDSSDPAPSAQITFAFAALDAGGHELPVHLDLSAVARWGETVFLGCDETAGVEALDPSGTGLWARHRHTPLADFVDLPEGPEGEIDIEGMDVDDGWLWITGSHSLKRPLPKPGETPAKALEAFADLKFDRNRQFLGRVPLAAGPEGLVPVDVAGDRRVGHLDLTRKGKLRKWLKDDPLVGPSLAIPSKENGFDVEGLAARGLRVWLGLRGPVLRGHAVIVELELKDRGFGQLKAKRLEDRRRYRLHLVPTNGEGIRDLVLDGDDLVMLTGTTMAGDGPSAILRWHGGALADRSGLRPPAEVSTEVALPYRGTGDNPEGLVRWDDDHWLVVHDSPEEARLPGGRQIRADLWPVRRPRAPLRLLRREETRPA